MRAMRMYIIMPQSTFQVRTEQMFSSVTVTKGVTIVLSFKKGIAACFSFKTC